jgi:hypothetical protein
MRKKKMLDMKTENLRLINIVGHDMHCKAKNQPMLVCGREAWVLQQRWECNKDRHLMFEVKVYEIDEKYVEDDTK